MQKHLFALCLACSLLCSAAQADPTGQIVGIGKKFFSTLEKLKGSTEITPVYALHKWRKTEHGYYRNIRRYEVWNCERDVHTGRYDFVHKMRNHDGTWSQSREAFKIPDLKRWNYQCKRNVINPDGSKVRTEFNCLQDFEIAVWASKIVRTGYFSPDGPFPVWLKTSATRLPHGCAPVNPDVRDVRKATTIKDSGYSVLKMGLVDYEYAWPMTCWTGDWYQY